MEKRLFTSESVTEGHPDKVCDAISDAILDACMEKDPMSRVACETATCTGFVLVTGEITSRITEHHTLVARAGRFNLFLGHFLTFCFQCFINTHCNIRGLFVDCYHNRTGIAVETVFGFGITDLFYGIAYDLLNIYVSVGCNFTANR